ncbi:hypothetical protein HY837_02820 [archaeon]|nr:hypothetical protein [archaeon]
MLYDLMQTLPVGGLIYVSDHDHLCITFDNKNQNYIASSSWTDKHEENIPYQLLTCSFLPEGLVIDHDLTNKSRQFGKGLWTPAVYRNI